MSKSTVVITKQETGRLKMASCTKSNRQLHDNHSRVFQSSYTQNLSLFKCKDTLRLTLNFLKVENIDCKKKLDFGISLFFSLPLHNSKNIRVYTNILDFKRPLQFCRSFFFSLELHMSQNLQGMVSSIYHFLSDTQFCVNFSQRSDKTIESMIAHYIEYTDLMHLTKE